MKMFHGVLILCLILTASSIWIYFALSSENDNAQYLRDVTTEIKAVFKALDKNDDGYLDIIEFSALKDNYKIFMHNKEDPLNYKIQDFPSLPTKIGEQIINITADFKPLDLHSLKKNISAIPKNELGSLQGLLTWQMPHKAGYRFGSNSFSLFLPKDGSLKIGAPWWIIEPKLDKYSPPVTSNRYFPPIVEEKYHLLFALLSLFHPYPFLFTRFAPQGTAAVVRAVEGNFYDIIFRVHAEFQLNKPPLYPFWFTPAQFSGRIIINRDATIVKFFHMVVPVRNLNVDMEWLNGPTEDSMEVDIGFVPQMSLSSLISNNQNVSNLKWGEEISEEEALDALELYFFPFKEVQYHSMPSAFEIAQAKSKLVHGIILWGNLDDQSC